MLNASHIKPKAVHFFGFAHSTVEDVSAAKRIFERTGPLSLDEPRGNWGAVLKRQLEDRKASLEPTEGLWRSEPSRRGRDTP